MGRTTFESIGKPLVDRTNIVLTRNPDYRLSGGHVAESTETALAIANDHLNSSDPDGRIHVIGGGEIYGEFIALADRLELTLVDAAPDGDAFFPVWDETDWTVVGSQTHASDPASGQPAFEFRTLDRRR